MPEEDSGVVLAMPRTSLPEIQKRLEICSSLPPDGSATITDFYSLDVGFLLARLERLEAALRGLVDDSWMPVTQRCRYCHGKHWSEATNQGHHADCPLLAARAALEEKP